ncbi:hypothetical protein U9M48_044488 [Paspalum notatum var. saurae]|uniref:Myb/SANT-like domain-containing protein n=1 Tax=Paspalum notatum var. saurae TaxID=547442 RepID=A0AAQ3UV55_PASNO
MANKRAHWSEETMKTFLDLCIAEKNVMNFNTKGLNAVGRKNVHRNFRLKTGLRYDDKQLQSKLTALRKTYNNWRDLQNRTGLGRNTNNGAVDTCDAEPTRGNPPPFLEELEILFSTNIQARGILLSAGGVRATNDTFATPQPIYQSSDRSRPKRSLWEQSMDSPKKKKTSIEECLRDISYAVTRHSHGQKSNNYDVA